MMTSTSYSSLLYFRNGMTLNKMMTKSAMVNSSLYIRNFHHLQQPFFSTTTQLLKANHTPSSTVLLSSSSLLRERSVTTTSLDSNKDTSTRLNLLSYSTDRANQMKKKIALLQSSIRFSSSGPKSLPMEQKQYDFYNKKTDVLLHPIRYMKWRIKCIDHAREAYELCSMQYEKQENFFVGHLGLEEKFENWFAVTVLHLWMYNTRLRMVDGNGSKEMRQELVEHFYLDLEIKLVEAGYKHNISKISKDLLASFYGQSLAFDEGLYHGDAILAAALWRNIFSAKEMDATKLVSLIEYIRKQLNHFENASEQSILESKVEFISVN